jgi:uncharacterized protein (TIGR02001 family)
MNKQLLAMLILLTALSGPALAADLSANIGFNSDYIFRGVKLSPSSANGGVDLTEGGWYVGTWLADVDTANTNGIEIDLYGGWTGQTNEWSYGVGGTGYLYTDSMIDNTYYELNLMGSYNLFTLDIAIGKYDTTPSQNYTFASGTFEKAGFIGKVGVWAQDFSGYYLKFGYGKTLAVQDTELFDWTIALIKASDIENLCTGAGCAPGEKNLLADHTSIVLAITRSFGVWSSK